MENEEELTREDLQQIAAGAIGGKYYFFVKDAAIIPGIIKLA